MLPLLIVSLSEFKSCGVVPFLYIKIIKQRTLQAFTLKHSIKKRACFHFWVNWTCLRRAGRSHLPSSRLGYAPTTISWNVVSEISISISKLHSPCSKKPFYTSFKVIENLIFHCMENGIFLEIEVGFLFKVLNGEKSVLQWSPCSSKLTGKHLYRYWKKNLIALWNFLHLLRKFLKENSTSLDKTNCFLNSGEIPPCL